VSFYQSAADEAPNKRLLELACLLQRGNKFYMCRYDERNM